MATKMSGSQRSRPWRCCSRTSARSGDYQALTVLDVHAVHRALGRARIDALQASGAVGRGLRKTAGHGFDERLEVAERLAGPHDPAIVLIHGVSGSGKSWVSALRGCLVCNPEVMPMQVFADRTEAGIALGRAVAATHPPPPLLVLGLPRGGVPLALEVARILHAPLDVLVVRKVGMPMNPEVALGAVASGGAVVREPHAARVAFGHAIDFEALAARELEEVRRRETLFRPTAAPLDAEGKTVVLVDDGLATGSTMTAAVRALRSLGAGRIVVAAPVASQEAYDWLASVADDCVILSVPPDFYAVSQVYEDFPQVEDAVVQALLREATA